MSTTFDELLSGNPVEQTRLMTLRQALRPYVELFAGKVVLDFGASHGLSAVAMIELGARQVVGVEPDAARVKSGTEMLARVALADRISLRTVSDTRDLPLEAASFDFILANAVFEHIPQPRDAYVRELWRVLAPGGALLINETPNKYLPADFHTLHLPLTNWLPSRVAHWIGVQTGRFKAARLDWDYSGWRGLGYYELVRAIPGKYRATQDSTRARHRILKAVGLPSAILDPYPVYLIHKLA
ncbi:MAG TPA: class I SAM-dependent methyltransferase [Tepidisphaeraceae bacterium]|jgi:ubiquinone/menaquinone biosynthesis C-methylase UbiE